MDAVNVVIEHLVGRPPDHNSVVSTIQQLGHRLRSRFGIRSAEPVCGFESKRDVHITGIPIAVQFNQPPTFDGFFDAEDYLEGLIGYRVYFVTKPKDPHDGTPRIDNSGSRAMTDAHMHNQLVDHIIHFARSKLPANCAVDIRSQRNEHSQPPTIDGLVPDVYATCGTMESKVEIIGEACADLSEQVLVAIERWLEYIRCHPTSVFVVAVPHDERGLIRSVLMDYSDNWLEVADRVVLLEAPEVVDHAVAA